MRTNQRWPVAVICLLIGWTTAATPAGAGEFWKGLLPVTEPLKATHRERPETCQDPPIEQLASQIDWLEHYIDEFGTIVAKHPDVWGESRLTLHRQEYEREMAAQVSQFNVTFQGSLARSDQAYLGFAMALQSAATGTTLGTTNNAAVNVNTLNSMWTSTGSSGGPSPITPPFGLITNSGTTGVALPGFNATNLYLEPTMMLNERSRYLNHLHELRRINEGSDTNDSPGYALDLVRVPVSVLPGKKTREGFGAEITITATPYLTPELLPATFRGLVINDLVDLLAPAITQWVNDPEISQSAAELLVSEVEFANEQIVQQSQLRQFQHAEQVAKVSRADAQDTAKLDAARKSARDIHSSFAPSWIARIPSLSDDPGKMNSEQIENHIASMNREYKAALPNLEGKVNTRRNKIRDVISKRHVPSIARTAGMKTRRAYMPMPPSQIVDVFGEHMIARMICDVHRSLSQHPVNRQLIHLMDVRGFLSEEAHAAYLFLGTELRPEETVATQPTAVEPPMGDIGANLLHCRTAPWAQNVDPDKSAWRYCQGGILAMAVRERRMRDVFEIRNNYLRFVNADHGNGNCLCPEPPVEPGAPGSTPSIDELPGPNPRDPNGYAVCKTLTAALGWGLLVESTLLNEQLNADYREAVISKGCSANCPIDARYEFYGPNPRDEARRAFVEYVRCRWPIRIFALDPVIDQQNIADAYSRRRELQVALAMGFVSGQVNAQSMLRFSRQLEWDMATVALNQTAVGFSHGDDTFGWRFYPRFQSPPVKGNLRTMWDTVAGGPTTDQDLRWRQLEPMQRECVAIVVMPSFVPYVTFETCSRFFKITNPKCTEISMRQTMLLSRSVKAMQQSAAQCSACAGCYRDGDVGRLMNRVHQLDQLLPLQSMQVQLPFENTAGGFELFNRGVTDLAPELVGWYGAPGIDVHGGTTLFIVGKGFAVNGTQVITGGRLAEFSLLSRDVMEVHVPGGVEVVSDRDANEFVDVHVGTCYGVTDHLLVPVAPASAIMPGGGSAALAMEPNHSISLTVTSTVANGKYSNTVASKTPNAPYLAFSAPPLSSLPGSLPVDVFVTVPNSSYVGTTPQRTFNLDTASGRYLLTGDSFANNLLNDVGGAIQVYLNLAYRSQTPPSPLRFQLRAQASPTSVTPIPITGTVDVTVEVLPP